VYVEVQGQVGTNKLTDTVEACGSIIAWNGGIATLLREMYVYWFSYPAQKFVSQLGSSVL